MLPRFWFLSVAATLLVTTPGLAREAPEAAHRLVFLLQYIGADYPEAVQEGKIINELEYEEMLEFADDARSKLGAIRAVLPAETTSGLEEHLDRLKGRIAAREDAVRIRNETDRTIALVVEALDLRSFPDRIPRTDRAERLYRDACATCHGTDGAGRGPEAADLEPPPADFTDRERMGTASPFRFYNAITFGIEDTGMASFADSLDEQERWDLAFFLWTFVAPDALPPEVAAIQVPLQDLATRSTDELADEVRQRAGRDGVGIDLSQAKALVDFLRARPRSIDEAGTPRTDTGQALLWLAGFAGVLLVGGFLWMAGIGNQRVGR